MTYINALARIDHKIESHLMFFLVHIRNRIDVGKSITFGCQPFTDHLAGIGQILARKSIIRFDLDKLVELILGNQGIAGYRHLGNLILLAFRLIDRDIDILLVRRNGYLRGIDVVFQIAVVHIVRTQSLKICR